MIQDGHRLDFARSTSAEVELKPRSFSKILPGNLFAGVAHRLLSDA